MTEARPPFAPFDLDSALAKVQAAEDAWNTRDPHQVALAYTEDSAWRNRDVVLTGRDKIVEFLTAKVPHRQVGARTRLRPAQEPVGLPWQPHGRALPVRVAQHRGPVVPLIRQRTVGVRRHRPDAPPRSGHQRPPHQ